MSISNAPAISKEKKAFWPYILVVVIFLYWCARIVEYVRTDDARFFMDNMILPVILCFTALSLLRSKPLKQPVFVLLLALCGWMIGTEFFLALKPSSFGVKNLAFSTRWLFHTVIYATVCFPLVFTLPDAQRKKLLHGLGHAFLAGVFAICVYALVVVFRHEIITNAQGENILGIVPENQRLYIFSNPNNSGMVLMLALLLCVYMLFSRKRWPGRVYYGIVLLVISVTLALTDSRANLVSASTGIGCLAFLYARKLTVGRMRTTWVWVIGIASAALGAALCYGLFTAEVTLVRSMLGSSLPSREVLTDAASGYYGGRIRYWAPAIEIIKTRPHLLWAGLEKTELSELLVRRSGISSWYFHSIFLQALLQYGLPGFLMLIAFFVLLGIKAIRLFLATDKMVPLALRFLPAILLACIIEETMESQLFMGIVTVQDPVFFIVAGVVVWASDKYCKRKPESSISNA